MSSVNDSQYFDGSGRSERATWPSLRPSLRFGPACTATVPE